MRSSKHWLAIAILTLAWAVAGCADDSEVNKTDGGTTILDGKLDGFKLPEGYVLFACKTPGTACNPHDDCAIDPICGDDLKCYPQALQNCDDGLECTIDSCLGRGECAHQPKENTCALPVKITDEDGKTTTVTQCFEEDQRNPSDACQICKTGVSDEGDPTKWTKANGGACDDGNPCTKDDYCQMGVCRGTDYSLQCADEYSCTEDICDGQGGCGGHRLREDSCLINGECYLKEQRDASGCYVCDPTKTQSQWTAVTDICSIDNKCYKRGETDSTACAVCDPDADPSGWTLQQGVCKIGNYCYQDGDPHPEGCAECNPAANPNAWTVVGDTCLIKGSWSDVCYLAGALSSNECSSCNPAVSKTEWTTLPDQCLIGNTCYATTVPDTTGCGVCDPDQSSTSWTVVGDKCLIDGKCYDPGDSDLATNCNDCDPATSKVSWTPMANKCFIGTVCYNDQSSNASGCLLCDYGSDASGWSAAPAVNLTSFTFEDGAPQPAGWTINNMPNVTVGWVVTNTRPWSGGYSLYYGDPNTMDYDTGDIHQGTATTPPITLTAGKKAGLSFLVWMETESSEMWDKLIVKVGNNVLWSKNTTTYPKMKTWREVHVDLSAYAGQTISISFTFDTVDDTVNSTEGTYLDNIVIYENC